jgi:hypothetical protein
MILISGFATASGRVSGEKAACYERERADDQNNAHRQYDQNRPVQKARTRLDRGFDDVAAFLVHDRLQNELPEASTAGAAARFHCVRRAHAPGTGEMPARTDALMPQPETGKINCVHRSPLRPVATRRMQAVNAKPARRFRA